MIEVPAPTRVRAGFALPIVLIAMVVLGIIVAGAFFSSTQEMRAGRNTLEYGRVFLAAEHGLALELANWNVVESTSLAIGSVSERTYPTHDGVTIKTLNTRVSPLSFWIVSEATAAVGADLEARRSVGSLIRLDIPELFLPAALTIRLPAGSSGGELADGVRVAGGDVSPSDWLDCPESSPSVGGFATDDPARWTGTDLICGEETCLTGDPPLLTAPRIADTVEAAEELNATWRALMPAVAITLPSGTMIGGPDRPVGPREIDGECDRSVIGNWGDPGRSTSCARYFPVIHAAGDLHVAGGAGQGVLLVEGDLTLSGGVTFVGLVLVRGGLRTIESGAHVIGAVRTAGEDGGTSALAGGRFDYSRCSLMHSLAPLAQPRIEPRTWVELYR